MGETGNASPVDRAEKALRTWSSDLSVETAARLLEGWKHVGELTDEQRAEVLARFEEPDGAHVSRITRCEVCDQLIEYVDGIEDPFWRHVEAVQPAPHAAKPKVVFS
jgi:hypothetical protein